jgi:hypothetical protein
LRKEKTVDGRIAGNRQMNEKTLKEISEILDKDADSITKGDSLRIGSFLTNDDFYLFTERFPEDTLTITKKPLI